MLIVLFNNAKTSGTYIDPTYNVCAESSIFASRICFEVLVMIIGPPIVTIPGTIIIP